MCFFSRKQLKEFVSDEKLVAMFPFNEREIEVMQLYANYVTFQKIGELQGGVTRQRVQEVYCNAMQKIARKFLEMMKEEKGVGHNAGYLTAENVTPRSPDSYRKQRDLY
jgi:hypothetical protein